MGMADMISWADPFRSRSNARFENPWQRLIDEIIIRAMIE